MRLFCTITTASHLPYTQALAESLRAGGNPEPLHVLLIGGHRPASFHHPQMVLVELDELKVPFPPLMCHYYDAFELCNALKPFFVSHLFECAGATAIIYLDGDLLVTASFGPVWAGLATASLLVTPHHLTPPPLAAKHTNEVDTIDLGFLNGGFAAWRLGPATMAMLQWMRERFAIYGFYRHLGMAADQKLLPLLLAYFPQEVRILFDPTLNVAYWNAHERAVTFAEGRWTIEGRPVVFFHLSGYKLTQPDLACAYISAEANRLLLSNAPWLPAVMARYRELITPYFSTHRPEPYRFNCFDGVRLNPAFRRLLFRAGRLSRGDPEFWRILITQYLRMLKRLLTGVRPLR